MNSFKLNPNSSADNTFGNKIKATVTVTNTNYIYGSSNTTKKADIIATSQTEIVAKALTDSMVGCKSCYIIHIQVERSLLVIM